MPTASPTSPTLAPRSTPAGIAATVAAVTVWGLGNTLVASIDLPGMTIAAVRTFIASLLYVPILRATGVRLTRESFRHGWQGGLAFGANISTFFIAVTTTTVASATTISALQPLIIMGFASVMFHERIRAVHVSSAVVATAGVALVAYGSATGGTGSLRGDLFGVLALLTWAWYFIASKKAREHLGTLEYLTVINIVAFAVVVPVAAAAGHLRPVTEGIGVGQLLAILAVVLVPGSGHLLINWAHRHTTLLLTSLATLAMPVIAAVGAAVFLDQRLDALQVGGMALVLVSLAAAIVADARR